MSRVRCENCWWWECILNSNVPFPSAGPDSEGNCTRFPPAHYANKHGGRGKHLITTAYDYCGEFTNKHDLIMEKVRKDIRAKDDN